VRCRLGDNLPQQAGDPIWVENIAECGWSDAGAIRGLVAHELGHIIHYHWRAPKKKLPGEGAWWQLYEEGFAQRCETFDQ